MFFFLVRLANEVSEGPERNTVDGGGRKKSDLYKSIVRLGQVVVAVEDGVNWDPPIVSVKVLLLYSWSTRPA
jgi:hypothetical protein